MSSFFDLSYDELILLATSIGLEISNGLNVNQQNILGNFISLMGQTILVANAVGSSYPPNSKDPNYGPPGVGEYFSPYRYGFKANSNGTSSTTSNSNDNGSKNSSTINHDLNNSNTYHDLNSEMYRMQTLIDDLIKRLEKLEGNKSRK